MPCQLPGSSGGQCWATLPCLPLPGQPAPRLQPCCGSPEVSGCSGPLMACHLSTVKSIAKSSFENNLHHLTRLDFWKVV